MVFSAEEEVTNTKNFRLMKTVMIIIKSMIQATVQFEQLTIKNDHIDLSHVDQDADQNSLGIVEVHPLDIPLTVQIPGSMIVNTIAIMIDIKEKDLVKNIISKIVDITADHITMVIDEHDQMTNMKLVGFHHQQDIGMIREDHDGEMIIWHNLGLKSMARRGKQ